jgi:hypothetical protein
VSGASVLLVGLETVMNFSRYTPLVRGLSLSQDGVSDATLKPHGINKTIGIV